MKRKDLTGKRFGRLTVIEYVGTKYDKNGKNAKAQWKCQCDCGNIRIVESASLLLGRSKSCGCLCREENSKRMKQQIKERGCYIKRLQEQLNEANEAIDEAYWDCFREGFEPELATEYRKKYGLNANDDKYK